MKERFAIKKKIKMPIFLFKYISFSLFGTLLILQLLKPIHLFAAEIDTNTQLVQALNLYNKGAYNQAISVLGKIKLTDKIKSTVFYWQGLSFNKLQEFEKATNLFKSAIKFGISAKDIYYEYGQALYAINELTLARKAFAQSAAKNYMLPSSYYYIGSIDLTLEQYHQALRHFKKIPLNEDKEVAQAASMQIGEIILIQAKKRSEEKKIVIRYVIPQLEIARKLDKESNLGLQIENRIKELKKLYDLDENKMINGKRVPEKKANLRFQENIQYDTNVIIEAEEAISKASASNKGSFISKSLVVANYAFVFKRRYSITPELRFNYDHYFQTNAPLIYKNETWSATPKVEAKVEHFIKKFPSTFQLELEYSYQARDANSTKNVSFYAKTFTLTMGEKISYFKLGESTFKIKRKQLEGVTKNLNSHTDSFSLGQNISLANKQLLLFLLSLDLTRLPNEDTSSSNSYLLRVDYIMTNFKIWNLRPSAAFTLTLLDTLKQSSTRGLEKMINPSLTLTKTISNLIDLSFKYDFTKNISKAPETNSYTKHVLGMEMTARF